MEELNKIYVGNLSWYADENDLYKLFGTCGKVNSVFIVRDKETQRNRGMAYVEMFNFEYTINALYLLRNKEIEGRTIRLHLATKREPRSRIKTDEIENPQVTIFDSSSKDISLDNQQSYEEYANDDLVKTTRSFNLVAIKYLKENPQKLQEMSSRDFEVFIAEIFRGLGYNVELTKETKDGGKDIIVHFFDPIGEKITYYIECKKYQPKNFIQVKIIRELHSVITSDKVNKGILVTTSSFTKGAVNLAENNKSLLSLKDGSDIINWIDLYINENS